MTGFDETAVPHPDNPAPDEPAVPMDGDEQPPPPRTPDEVHGEEAPDDRSTSS